MPEQALDWTFWSLFSSPHSWQELRRAIPEHLGDSESLKDRLALRSLEIRGREGQVRSHSVDHVRP